MADENVQKATLEEYKLNENDLLAGLFDAAQDKNQDYTTIEVARKGKVYLRFRIQPLSEDKYIEARKKATKYASNKAFGGMKTAIETDTAKMRSWLVYFATCEEDRKTLWDNKTAWAKLGTINGVDIIDKVLLAGEKDKIIDKIDEISGYASEETMEEEAGN
jgi:hypothetical protein